MKSGLVLAVLLSVTSANALAQAADGPMLGEVRLISGNFAPSSEPAKYFCDDC